MMEIGQPTHIFDYEKFGSKEILIRRGKKNEKLTTLDEIEREVSPNELLITNGKNPVAIAGVMGGLNSAVTSATTTVIIESAYFDPQFRGQANLNTYYRLTGTLLLYFGC